MKNWKENIYPILNGSYLLITLLFDVYANGRLPDTIATQFNAKGVANTMPKLTYMLITLGILLLLFMLGNRKEKTERIKYIAISTLLVIVNIIVLAIQF